MSTDNTKTEGQHPEPQSSASTVDPMTNGGSPLTPALRRLQVGKSSSPVHRSVTSNGRKVQPVNEPRTAPATPGHVHYNTFRTPFFSTVRSPRREYFTIHPEWASERIVPTSWLAAAAPPALQHHYQQPSTWTNTYPPPHTGRRCRSAPPGVRSRNPITWENWPT